MVVLAVGCGAGQVSTTGGTNTTGTATGVTTGDATTGATTGGTQPVAPPNYRYEVVKVLPHDPRAFTQGLVFHDGYFLEGTGLNGESTLRKVEVETGKVLKKVELEQKYFGEGIALLKDKIYQLTWQNQTGFVYELSTFKKLKSFEYPGEGWGITTDGEKLFVSDGTPFIRIWDPETLKETGRIEVKDERGQIWSLNELEYVKGEIFANVWQTDMIARVDPKTGKVTGWINVQGLLKPEYSRPGQPQPDVLNGIAYDAKNDRLFVTGKLWPKVFEIKLVKVG